MDNKDRFHKPKLYINQPKTTFPEIPMQSRYFIRAKVAEADMDQPKETVEIAAHELSTEFDSQQEETESGSNPFDTKRRKTYSFKRVKNFKEMNIDEKIQYLDHYPEQLPPVSCLYITTNSSITGILLEVTDDGIEVILPNRTRTTISKSDLQDIQMLGFH